MSTCIVSFCNFALYHDLLSHPIERPTGELRRAAQQRISTRFFVAPSRVHVLELNRSTSLWGLRGRTLPTGQQQGIQRRAEVPWGYTVTCRRPKAQQRKTTLQALVNKTAGRLLRLHLLRENQHCSGPLHPCCEQAEASLQAQLKGSKLSGGRVVITHPPRRQHLQVRLHSSSRPLLVASFSMRTGPL